MIYEYRLLSPKGDIRVFGFASEVSITGGLIRLLDRRIPVAEMREGRLILSGKPIGDLELGAEEGTGWFAWAYPRPDPEWWDRPA